MMLFSAMEKLSCDIKNGSNQEDRDSSQKSLQAGGRWLCYNSGQIKRSGEPRFG